jgi:hypothetical protein
LVDNVHFTHHTCEYSEVERSHLAYVVIA